MDARAQTVREILSSSCQFLVPFFQRQYSWRHKQWKRLREDVWALREDPQHAMHFLGPLVCTPLKITPGDLSRFQLIDGQQRLTTLTILLAAIRDAARDSGQNELAARIDDEFLVRRYGKGLDRYRIMPRLGDREALFAMIEHADLAKFRSLQVIRAWDYFYREVQNAVAGSSEAVLGELFVATTAQLSLVVITIDGENPYEIFESLNSTGLPLEESDLIRNYLFMQVPTAEQEQFHKVHWEAFEEAFETSQIPTTGFYRDYLMRLGTYSKAKQTFVDFKEQNRRRNLAPAEQVAELSRFVTYERWLRDPKSCDDWALRRRLYEIQELEITTAHPLVLHLLDRRHAQTLAPEQLLGCLDDLASFVLRRSICGESTRSYGRWFTEAISCITNQPQSDLRGYLTRRGWPDDRSFTAKLVDFPIYRRESKKCRLILERLEIADGHKEQVDLRTTTIEHVLPQAIKDGKAGKAWQTMLGEDWRADHEQWVHTLGNLTLSGYNGPMGNKAFAEKLAVLKLSKLSLNGYFAGRTEWNAHTIQRRGEVLAGRVAELWGRPAEGAYIKEDDGTSKSLTKEQKRILRRAYWTSLLGVLGERGTITPLPKPSRGGWLGFRVLPSAFRLSAFANPKRRWIGVSVACRGPKRQQHFAALHGQQAAIESEIGTELQWHESPLEKASYILLVRSKTSPEVEAQWSEQHDWLADKLAVFAKVFVSRCQALSPESFGQDDLRRKFWTQLLPVAAAKTPLHADVSPGKFHWLAAGAGLAGLAYNYIILKHGWAVELFIHRGKGKKAENKQIFDALNKRKDQIEKDFGDALTWERLDHRSGCRIVKRSEGGGCRDDESSWPAIHQAMVDGMMRLEAAISPSIKAIKAELH